MVFDLNGDKKAPTQGDREQMMNAIRDAFATNATDVKCESCENDTFSEVIRIKRLSAIASPTGEEMVLPFKVFICSKCNSPIPEMK
jgi:hypothetical protein